MDHKTTSTNDLSVSAEPTPRAIPPDAFATAVRARDLGAVRGLFAEDAELYTPMVAEPITGGSNIEQLFVFLNDILQDIEITTEISDSDHFVLGFNARIGAEPIEIVDLLSFDAQGRITKFVVHTRPMAGTTALAAAIDPNREHFRA